MTERLTFGHIINHREPKGSRFVLDSVHAARMAGADFGFIFAERLSHEDAMKLYNFVDVLLEQFVIGWYGLQACEFALMDKPVVVYLRIEDGPPLVPSQLWLDIPLIKARPDELTQRIIDICNMSRDALTNIGNRGSAFVKKWHSDKVVAEQMLNELLSIPDKYDINKNSQELSLNDYTEVSCNELQTTFEGHVTGTTSSTGRYIS
jgi:hypothetical protein